MRPFIALCLISACASPTKLTVEWYDGLPDQCGLTGSEVLAIEVITSRDDPRGTYSAVAIVDGDPQRKVYWWVEYDGASRGIYAQLNVCTQNFYVRSESRL